MFGIHKDGIGLLAETEEYDVFSFLVTDKETGEKTLQDVTLTLDEIVALKSVDFWNSIKTLWAFSGVYHDSIK